MGAADPARGVQVGLGLSSAEVARVVTEVAGMDKEFDYLVPDGMAVSVGSQVRVNLSGRRVGGWVTAVGVEPPAGIEMRPIAKLRGVGPEPDVVDLCTWAAWRWAGRRRAFLTMASSRSAVPRLPPPALRPPPRPPSRSVLPESLGIGSLAVGRATVLRLPPASDPTAVVAELAQRGPTLVVVPSVARAAILAARLRRAGGGVALLPDGWAQARAGAAVVIGARAAAWAPCPGLAAAVVLDGHDESLGQEGTPTWHAVAAMVERARRASAPCVIISACPTPELLWESDLAVTDRTTERAGWAKLEVLDRRGDDPRLGLYSERLVSLIRSEGRVLCVLNRTGRARVLACAACGELARCEECGAALAQDATRTLRCPRCGLTRPQVCAACGSTRLKVLRVGVSRAREELELLAGRSVAEVTAASEPTVAGADVDVIVGTEAVLHRYGPADGFGAVVFVDFDQELLAARMRTADEALGLLAQASRLVGGRAGKIIVQTRLPETVVLRAAILADPSVLSDHELGVRRSLRLPPFTAIALVSGAGAPEYVDRLRTQPVSVDGPDGDRWLVRAADVAVLADALAAVPRPASQVRVAVEPARM